jgi:hypothetical protein
MIRNILIIAVVCLLAMACAAQNCDRENEINSIRAQRDAGAITNEQAVLLTDMERQAWTACNLAALQANTAAFDQLAPRLEQLTAEINALARKKWCHQNPWRFIRGYREPKWCKQ